MLGENENNEDIKLPALNPLIRLFKSTPDREGQPRWSLYYPAANQYYHVNWSEFECLARFHKHESAKALIEEVNAETTLDIDLDDIKTLIIFLQKSGLVVLENQTPEMPAAMPLWKRMIHGYLFFTLPLFKPANFLQNTLPYVRPFLSKGFMALIFVLLGIGLLLTMQRFDEFTHTFLDMFSVKGAIITFFVFTVIKIIHELSHAYVATKHGVDVPHMGVALIVMYPVLYTETTASWRLDSKQKRIEIALAGVMAELALAAVFLLLWHILPPGTGRSISFAVVAISLIGSLFVNLNPMMRFDGYFVLSDWLNIENLHARAIALARWKMRKVLFGLKDDAPDQFEPSLHKFLIAFGFAILIYRFFLFLGIAVLVYYVFFKPLGAIMMALELLWFIGLPVWNELKIWWQRKADIVKQPRAYISLVIIGALCLFWSLPLHTTISVSGVLETKDYRAIYAPSAAYIETLNVQDQTRVKQGDILAILKSETLEKELEKATLRLNSLERLNSREKTNIELYRQNAADIENELLEVRQAIEVIKEKRGGLIVKAPFDGVIRDLSPDIHVGRSISSQDLLFRLIKEQENNVIAYIGEEHLQRIKSGNKAIFYPDFSPFGRENLIVTSIEPVNLKTLTKAELSSLYGGHVPSISEQGRIVPLEPTYMIRFKLLKNNNIFDSSQRGYVRIQADNRSGFLLLFNRIVALFIRETSFN